MDEFWKLIEKQIEDLKRVTTVHEIMVICPRGSGFSEDFGFFGGSGGDYSVLESLEQAGWTLEWWRAHYYWCAKSADGSEFITYIEGDLQRGRQRPL